MRGCYYLLCILLSLCYNPVSGQETKRDTIIATTDSTTIKKNFALTKDTLVFTNNGKTVKVVEKHSPKKATLRSLAVPGWGQVYNKELWKVPLIYGALGTTAGIFIYNNIWYKRTRDAYDIKLSNDTARFGEIHPRLDPLRPQDLIIYRNSFRRDRDYSALWFIIFWGLNVVDATVFAHLKNFDVSDDLSLNVNPAIGTGGSKGISLVLSYKSKKPYIFNVR